MSFLGKEFKYEKEENFEGFLAAIGIQGEAAEKLRESKPTTKLEKDGDSYIVTNVTPAKTTVVKFQSGVEQDEEIRPDLVVKSTYTVDGSTVTQVIEKDGKSVTFKREFSDTSLKVTITADFWDGTAYRYYTA